MWCSRAGLPDGQASFSLSEFVVRTVKQRQAEACPTKSVGGRGLQDLVLSLGINRREIPRRFAPRSDTQNTKSGDDTRKIKVGDHARVTTFWAIVKLIFAVLLAISPACATTYYVAAAGSDSNSGTDTGHPWKTIAKVNGATFSAGDSILFNRGDAWYGTALTAPSSGASGSPITFSAYGSGANPIFKGSTLLTTSGYVLGPNTSTTIFSLSDSGTSSTDSGTRNWRESIASAGFTGSATKITVTVKASATAALNITGAAIGLAATVPNSSSMTRITWGGGNNGTTVSAGATATSDAITYTLSSSVGQIVSI
jgi:hypothetical protein